VECGKGINLKPTMNYTFTAPNYVCNPENCDVEYKWEVVDPDGIILSGIGKTLNYTFSNYGTYEIIFTPICGGNRCEPCIIYVNIEKFIQYEPDPIGIPYELPNGIIKDVYNPATGKTWMNKNLGATRVATSPTDAAAFGDLYQWGRLTDGHEKRNSGITTMLSSSNIPGNGKFITTTSSQPDWRSPKNNTLWQGVSGINNPCPSGYRLPTEAELNAERLTWISNDVAGAYASPLKWVAAGARNKNGTLDVASKGYYWTSTVSGNDARSLRIFSANANIYGGMVPNRGAGMSVRCIKN
jgi:hypothetical protein